MLFLCLFNQTFGFVNLPWFCCLLLWSCLSTTTSVVTGIFLFLEITQTIWLILVSPPFPLNWIKSTLFWSFNIWSHFFLNWILYTFRKKKYFWYLQFLVPICINCKFCFVFFNSFVLTNWPTIFYLHVIYNEKFTVSIQLVCLGFLTITLSVTDFCSQSLFDSFWSFVHWCLNCSYIFCT